MIVLLTHFLTYYFSLQKLLVIGGLSQRGHLPHLLFSYNMTNTPVRRGLGVTAAPLEFGKSVSLTSRARSQKTTQLLIWFSWEAYS